MQIKLKTAAASAAAARARDIASEEDGISCQAVVVGEHLMVHFRSDEGDDQHVAEIAAFWASESIDRDGVPEGTAVTVEIEGASEEATLLDLAQGEVEITEEDIKDGKYEVINQGGARSLIIHDVQYEDIAQVSAKISRFNYATLVLLRRFRRRSPSKCFRRRILPCLLRQVHRG